MRKLELINLSKEQMEKWITHQDSWMTAGTLGMLYRKSKVINGYTFQLTKQLTSEELENPNRTITRLCHSLPTCLKQTFCVLIIYEEINPFDPSVRFRFKNVLSRFLSEEAVLRDIHINEPTASIDKVTLCFFGVPITEAAVHELSSHELVAPCAKEQVRQKRLLSLYK